MYAKVSNGSVVKYPFTQADLQAQYPNSSVPYNWSDAFKAAEGIVNVITVGSPSHNPLTQTVEESNPVFVSERNRWETAWTVRSKTSGELAQTIADIQTSIVAATQARLDDFAKTRNYDGILSLCTYATSSVTKFATEGQYGVNVRDLTWATLYTIMDQVQAGTRPMPTGYTDVEPLLPALSWPV